MTTIDFTWSTPEWTEADSDALDAAIIAERERSQRGRYIICQLPFTRNNRGGDGFVGYGGRGRCFACYKRAIRRGEI